MNSSNSGYPLVIVSCTDRKSLRVKSELKVRSFSESLDVQSAASRWAEAVKTEFSSGTSTKLRDLYQGEYWQLVLQIEKLANVRVASAGIGLHALDDLGIGYSATFTSGQDDSIHRFVRASFCETEELWWRAVNANDSVGNKNWVDNLSSELNCRVVFTALSVPYQKALCNDIIRLADSDFKVFVVSGSKIPRELCGRRNVNPIRVTQRIRMILSGSTSTVAIRFVHELLKTKNWQTLEKVTHHLDFLESKYLELPKSKKLPELKRTPLGSDDDVKNWIRKEFKKTEIANLTKSRMLRRLRDKENRGCEQKRFGRLFEEVLEEVR